MKTKVLLFDFDKTLTTKDSIWALWLWTFRRKPLTIPYFIFTIIRHFFLYLLNGRDYDYIKEGNVKVLKFHDDNSLKSFVKEDLLKNYMLDEGVEFLKEKQKEGYVTILVSASVENYLKYIVPSLPFDYIIGTKLQENLKILGLNNKGAEKVLRIKTLLERENIEIDYENSHGFSDSFKDDRYMLELVANRHLINSQIREKGYINIEWK